MNYPYNNPYNYRYAPVYPNSPYNVTPLPYIQPEPVQQTVQPTLRGGMVQSTNQITADNVPMDGSVAFFPLQDLSEIYAKKWNADGTIQTIVFKPATTPSESHDDSDTAMLNELSVASRRLSEQLDRLEATVSKFKTRNFNSRKDGGTE